MDMVSAPDNSSGVFMRTHWLGLLTCAMVLVVTKRVFTVAHVYGQSMTPTLRDGDYVLGLQLPIRRAWLWHVLRRQLLRRGAVVLLYSPAHLSRLNVKRIDGLPGDTRAWGWKTSATGPHPLPADHVFLVSDASHQADVPGHDTLLPGPPIDSRLYGPLPMTTITARVLARCWPPGRLGLMTSRLGQA